MSAARWGHVDSVRVLLEAGADIEQCATDVSVPPMRLFVDHLTSLNRKLPTRMRKMKKMKRRRTKRMQGQGQGQERGQEALPSPRGGAEQRH